MSIASMVLVVATMYGCGDTSTFPSEIEFGKVEGSTYTNRYFGMSIQIAAGWSVQDQDAQRRLMERGRQTFVGMIAGEDENLNSLIKASELHTVNLLIVFKHPVDAPVPYNPGLISVAVRVYEKPGINRGKDYLFHSKKLMESSELSVSFPERIYSEQLGGKDFDVLKMDIAVGGSIIHQKQYVTIMNGYALILMVSFTSEEEQAELDEALRSVRFE